MSRLRIVVVMLAVAFATPVEAQAPCPSSEIGDVMRDPAVQDALERAGRGAREGQADEHEEGRDIYQCRVAKGDGSYSYRTEVRPWEPGSMDGVSGGDFPTADGSCRHVATYHTHPG